MPYIISWLIVCSLSELSVNLSMTCCCILQRKVSVPEVDVIVVGDSSDENEHYVVSDSSSPRSRYNARAFLIPACAVNIIQMMHGCKWNIQICCPEVDMSSRGRSPSDDISTEGQHI